MRHAGSRRGSGYVRGCRHRSTRQDWLRNGDRNWHRRGRRHDRRRFREEIAQRASAGGQTQCRKLCRGRQRCIGNFLGRRVGLGQYLHQYFEITDEQAIAIGEGLQSIARHHRLRRIESGSVGADILEVVHALRKADIGMTAGDQSLRIRKHPVIALDAADAAAAAIEDFVAGSAQQLALMADHAERE